MAGAGTAGLRAQTSGTCAGMLLGRDNTCVGNRALTTRANWTNLTGTVSFPRATSRLTLTQSACVAISAPSVVRRRTIASREHRTVNFDAANGHADRFPLRVK